MQLYEYAMAPNPRRVRIFLVEKGIAVDTVQVDIPAGENLAPAFRAVNPRGVLPTLVLDDGTVIDESVAICRYFEELHPEPALMGSDARSKAVIESAQRRMEWDGLLPAGDAFRNGNPVFADRALPGSEGVPAIAALAERGRAAMQRFFDALDATLAAQPFVAGEAFSIADITAFCAIDFAKWAKLRAGEAHPNLLRWHAEVGARPSARA